MRLTPTLSQNPTMKPNMESGNENKEHHPVNGKIVNETGELSRTPEHPEFGTEMQALVNTGFRTDHVYRQLNILRRASVTFSCVADAVGDQIARAELQTTIFSLTNVMQCLMLPARKLPVNSRWPKLWTALRLVVREPHSARKD